MTTLRPIRLAPLAACATLLVAAHGVRAQAGDPIEGTWVNDVQIVRCSDQLVMARFQSMTTYLRGGVLVEGGSPSTPPPAVSRSAGHGVWARGPGQTIRAEIRAHFFDSMGRLVRVTEIRTTPELMPGDDPSTPDIIEPYYLEGWGTNVITSFDPVTGAKLAQTAGCNYAVSRPMLLGR